MGLSRDTVETESNMGYRFSICEQRGPDALEVPAIRDKARSQPCGGDCFNCLRQLAQATVRCRGNRCEKQHPRRHPLDLRGRKERLRLKTCFSVSHVNAA